MIYYKNLDVPFCSEDITKYIGKPNGEVEGSNKNNAVGGTMNALCKKHGLVKVGTTKSKDKKNHGSEIRLWGNPR